MREKKEAFEIYDEEVQLVGYATCGGCCGRDAVRRAATMVKPGQADGAEAIHLSGCLWGGSACPFKERIKSDIENYLKVPVVLGTHHKFEKDLAAQA